MINEMQVPIFELASSLSSAMDLISPAVANHHKQVAYISYHIAAGLGLTMARRKDLLLAGTLHDIGAMSVQERISSLDFEIKNPHVHCEIGYRLLRKFRPFAQIANIVRFHHVEWQDGKGTEAAEREVPLESHIIHLADRIAVLVKPQQEIFAQVQEICSVIEANKGRLFHPELIACFKELSTKEFFWLDLISDSTSLYPQNVIPTDVLVLNSNEILDLAQLVSNIIDFRSPFTAIHSAGVAATAVAIARFLPFSEKERFNMRIAGYLHDIGKLAVPHEILEKPDKLTPPEWNIMRRHTYYGYHILEKISGFKVINEWATFHHERLDGAGYPFHIKGEELSMGSRVMAIADLFTAVSEDRPYRKAMTDEAVIKVIQNQANNGGIDPAIAALVTENFQEIKALSLIEQTETRRRYQELYSKPLRADS